jgi:alpha-tubulin suppressor-like RCC1 family protein
MNISHFQILLQEAIDNATETVDYLLLSKALESLNVGQIRTVATFANLPSAASNEGLLVFVTADERLYWSTGTDWYSIVTENKGLAWAWGQNSVGSLGDATTTNRSSPVSVVGGFTDWCQIDTSGSSFSATHVLAVRQNGTAWAWGLNGSGRLGDGTITSRTSPVSVVGGFTDWCQVSAGTSHSLGLRQNGTAWAWGLNNSGQLGTGTTTARSSPVSVVGGFTDWCQVSAGSYHSLGVRQDGSAWAWGAGSCGRLGSDTTTNTSSPVSVIGGFTDWCQVSAGGCHSLGVRQNGTVWSWGYNHCGQLGDGTTTSRTSPVSVVGGFTDWCQVSAGGCHSLGVRENGTAWAWGANTNGRLGDGTTTSTSSPVSVVGGFTDWCQVSAGINHSLGVRQNGTAWAWGFNTSGQLGDGTTTGKASPVSIAGGFTDWCQVSAGCARGLALRKTDFT